MVKMRLKQWAQVACFVGQSPNTLLDLLKIVKLEVTIADFVARDLVSRFFLFADEMRQKSISNLLYLHQVLGSNELIGELSLTQECIACCRLLSTSRNFLVPLLSSTKSNENSWCLWSSMGHRDYDLSEVEVMFDESGTGNRVDESDVSRLCFVGR